MTRWRRAAGRGGALALGLLLGALMFVRYGWLAPHGKAHTDHAARHGGVLGMVGDLHLEIVRGGGRITVYVSDAQRRAVRARAGRVEFDEGPTVPLTWDGTRLVAPDAPEYDTVTCTVELMDGETAEMSAYLASAD